MSEEQKVVCGGINAENPATEEIQALVDSLTEEIKEKSSKKDITLKAVSFKSQVVAGTNYFVKVHTGGEEDHHLHVRIFKPLPCHGTKAEVHSIQENKTKHDSIEYF